MSITKELREWAYSSTTNEALLSNPPRHVVHGVLETLIGIADRIDAEHEKALTEMRDRAYNEGYDEGFASADDVLSREENDMLEEHGWVRLPRDADGVPIRIGDDAIEVDYNSHNSVTQMRIDSGGWWVFVGGVGRRPNKIRHYHAPTVEDVMVEFATDWESAQDGEDKTAVLKEYAKRLTLAGDAE